MAHGKAVALGRPWSFPPVDLSRHPEFMERLDHAVAAFNVARTAACACPAARCPRLCSRETAPANVNFQSRPVHRLGNSQPPLLGRKQSSNHSVPRAYCRLFPLSPSAFRPPLLRQRMTGGLTLRRCMRYSGQRLLTGPKQTSHASGSIRAVRCPEMANSPVGRGFLIWHKWQLIEREVSPSIRLSCTTPKTLPITTISSVMAKNSLAASRYRPRGKTVQSLHGHSTQHRQHTGKRCQCNTDCTTRYKAGPCPGRCLR
ncbi:MAG: hypothetical protein K0Q43_2650 [Ramlibacter sp.]|nr:hypothetical protein [Ramlibacter sp.]